MPSKYTSMSWPMPAPHRAAGVAYDTMLESHVLTHRHCHDMDSSGPEVPRPQHHPFRGHRRQGRGGNRPSTRSHEQVGPHAAETPT